MSNYIGYIVEIDSVVSRENMDLSRAILEVM